MSHGKTADKSSVLKLLAVLSGAVIWYVLIGVFDTLVYPLPLLIKIHLQMIAIVVVLKFMYEEINLAKALLRILAILVILVGVSWLWR